jgi:hypothetical protein
MNIFVAAKKIRNFNYTQNDVFSGTYYVKTPLLIKILTFLKIIRPCYTKLYTAREINLESIIELTLGQMNTLRNWGYKPKQIIIGRETYEGKLFVETTQVPTMLKFNVPNGNVDKRILGYFSGIEIIVSDFIDGVVVI